MGAAACAPPVADPREILARPRARSIDGWHSQPARAEWLDAALPDYGAATGTDLSIRWTQVPDPARLVQTLLITINSGAAFPDIVDLDPSWGGRITRLAPSPLLALQDRLKGGSHDFVQAAFTDPWTVGGRVHALASELNLVLLGYRTDVYSASGVRAPLPTWDDAIDAGRRVAARAPDGLFFVRADAAGTVLALATQAGGGFVGRGGVLQLDHPANVRALGFLESLVNRDRAAAVLPFDRPGGNRPGGDMLGDAARAAFRSGSVAGDIGPMARLSGEMRVDAPETAGRWHVQALPRWPGAPARQPGVVVPGSGLAVLKESPAVDLAADFVTWAHLGHAPLLDFERRQTWPVNRRLYEDPRLADPVPWFHGQSVGTILREASASVVACAQGPYWPEIARVLTPAIRAVMNGQADARGALAEAQIAARALVVQAGGSPG